MSAPAPPTAGSLSRAALLPRMAIVLCAFLGGSSVVYSETLLLTYPPLFLLGLRFSLAAAVFALLFPRAIFPLSREALVAGATAGSGFGLGSALLYIALRHVNAGKATFLVALEVLLVPIFCFLFLKQRLARGELIALLPAVVGLWLMCGGSGGLATSWWELVALASAAGYALYTISLSHLSARAPVTSRTFVSLALIGASALALSFLIEPRPKLHWDLRLLIGLVYLVGACSLGRFLLQGWAQSSLSPSFVVLAFTSEPLFALALSFTFLGERLSAAQSCGAVCILCALLLAVTARPHSGQTEAVP